MPTVGGASDSKIIREPTSSTRSESSPFSAMRWYAAGAMSRMDHTNRAEKRGE
jgi:hypothetical protein